MVPVKRRALACEVRPRVQAVRRLPISPATSIGLAQRTSQPRQQLGDVEAGHDGADQRQVTAALRLLVERVLQGAGCLDDSGANAGTPFFGMVPHRLPQQVDFFGQPLWASIGYALPAMLGACLARPGRRGVLLIGDGAAQMTVQELSTMIRQGTRALVLVVDNDGYTTERAIHGPDEPYITTSPGGRGSICRLRWHLAQTFHHTHRRLPRPTVSAVWRSRGKQKWTVGLAFAPRHQMAWRATMPAQQR